jgi:fructosamine-3-kinase
VRPGTRQHWTPPAPGRSRPLAGGWRERVGLHQLFPLLVHAVLFGAGYGAQAASVAARYA